MITNYIPSNHETLADMVYGQPESLYACECSFTTTTNSSYNLSIQEFPTGIIDKQPESSNLHPRDASPATTSSYILFVPDIQMGVPDENSKYENVYPRNSLPATITSDYILSAEDFKIQGEAWRHNTSFLAMNN